MIGDIAATGPDDVGTSAVTRSVPTDGIGEAGEFGGGRVVVADAAARAWLAKGSTRAKLFSLRVLSKDARDESGNSVWIPIVPRKPTRSKNSL